MSSTSAPTVNQIITCVFRLGISSVSSYDLLSSRSAGTPGILVEGKKINFENDAGRRAFVDKFREILVEQNETVALRLLDLIIEGRLYAAGIVHGLFKQAVRINFCYDRIHYCLYPGKHEKVYDAVVAFFESVESSPLSRWIRRLVHEKKIMYVDVSCYPSDEIDFASFTCCATDYRYTGFKTVECFRPGDYGAHKSAGDIYQVLSEIEGVAYLPPPIPYGHILKICQAIKVDAPGVSSIETAEKLARWSDDSTSEPEAELLATIKDALRASKSDKTLELVELVESGKISDAAIRTELGSSTFIEYECDKLRYRFYPRFKRDSMTEVFVDYHTSAVDFFNKPPKEQSNVTDFSKNIWELFPKGSDLVCTLDTDGKIGQVHFKHQGHKASCHNFCEAFEQLSKIRAIRR